MFKDKTLINKESLGQHFFTNQELKTRMIEELFKEEFKQIVEIGPGTGLLTESILQRLTPSQHLLLIEKDFTFAERLRKQLNHRENISIIEGDVLSTDLTSLNENSVAFGSLPFNISKDIILRLLTETEIKSMFFVIQLEVAEKLNKPEEGPFYLLSTLLAKNRILFKIPRTSFSPQPNVNCAFIKLTRRNDSIYTYAKARYNDLELLAKVIFSSPRKTVANNLKVARGTENADTTTNVLRSLKQDSSELLTKRAEQLTLEEWIILTEHAKKHLKKKEE